MIDCNVTENCLNEEERMCSGTSCFACPLEYNKNKYKLSCVHFRRKYPLEYIKIVQAWSDSHPIKTYLSDFIEKYPKAKQEDIINECCVNTIYFGKSTCEYNSLHDKDCSKCWNTPLE